MSSIEAELEQFRLQWREEMAKKKAKNPALTPLADHIRDLEKEKDKWSKLPDELKLLCLKHYWLSVSPGPVNEKRHNELVQEHLIRLVQAFGQVAQESYYTTMHFCLTSEYPVGLKYPAYGHWVRHIIVKIRIAYSPREDRFEPRALLKDPHYWILRRYAEFRWLLRPKTLDIGNLSSFELASVRKIFPEQLPPTDKTRWLTTLKRLTSLKVIVNARDGGYSDSYPDGMMKALDKALMQTELPVKAKSINVWSAIEGCSPSNWYLPDWPVYSCDKVTGKVVQLPWDLKREGDRCQCEETLQTRLKLLAAETFTKGSGMGELDKKDVDKIGNELTWGVIKDALVRKETGG